MSGKLFVPPATFCALLEQSGLADGVFAALVGVTPQAVSGWKAGRISISPYAAAFLLAWSHLSPEQRLQVRADHQQALRPKDA
jgi:hypothetical protein